MNEATDIESENLGDVFGSASIASNPVCQKTLTKSKAKKSSRRVTLRLSEEEGQRLDRQAEGLTVSAYIRKCIFGDDTTRRKHRSHKPVYDQASMAKALALLGQSRMANNLNQLAHQANMGSLTVDEITLRKIEEAYEHIRDMRNQLIHALGLLEQQ